MANERRNRILGMLLGLHAGDSLGAPLEFSQPTVGEPIRDITGGRGWRAGEATDDTDLMLCLLKSLAENNGELVVDDVKKKYIAWLNSGPKDVGVCTSITLRGGSVGGRNQGNGSLMRCAPLAILKYVSCNVSAQCRITHDSDVAVRIDQKFIGILQDLLKTKGDKKRANEIVDLDMRCSDHSLLWREIKNDTWDKIENNGWCVASLLGACWAFYNTETLEDALIQIVNRGGDSDTVGAICGAICGAFYGMEEIPERWLSKLEQKQVIIENVDRLLLTPSA